MSPGGSSSLTSRASSRIRSVGRKICMRRSKRDLTKSREEHQEKRQHRVPRGEARTLLKDWFEENRHDLRGALGLSPQDEDPHVITAVVDRLTGKVYMAYSGRPAVKSSPAVDSKFLVGVQNCYDGSHHRWIKENCGECSAMNGLVGGRKSDFFHHDGTFRENAVFVNVEAYSVVASRGRPRRGRILPCTNCDDLHSDVDWIED